MTISWLTAPVLVTRNVTVPRGTVTWSAFRPMAPGCIGPFPSPIGPPESVRATFTTRPDEPGPVGAGLGSDPDGMGLTALPLGDFPEEVLPLRLKAIVAPVTRV